jgi:hypothetical protein
LFFWGLRPCRIMVCPCFAGVLEVSLPMPSEAPVTKIILRCRHKTSCLRTSPTCFKRRE